MKQLTDEICLAIFHQNIGSEVLIKEGLWHNDKGKITGASSANTFFVETYGGYGPTFTVKYLTLLKRYLSSIMDEEAKGVADILYQGRNQRGWRISKGVSGNIYIENEFDDDQQIIFHLHDNLVSCNCKIMGFLWWRCYQYLHSKGFALPYLDWSVEELIKENVYKLIE